MFTVLEWNVIFAVDNFKHPYFDIDLDPVPNPVPNPVPIPNLDPVPVYPCP